MTGGPDARLIMSLSILRNRSRALDVFEQVVVLALYGWLVWRLYPKNPSSLTQYPVLLLLSEGLVVVFLLIRRQTEQISANFRDWLVAFGATFAVMLVDKGGEPVSAVAATLLMLLGFILHVGAKLSLRRSFGLVAADRGIKRRGFYALVRHPMYAGYMLTHLGFLLMAPSLWNLAVYCVAWPLLIARIFAEERVLAANPEYRDYAARARYRLVPGVF